MMSAHETPTTLRGIVDAIERNVSFSSPKFGLAGAPAHMYDPAALAFRRYPVRGMGYMVITEGGELAAYNTVRYGGHRFFSTTTIEHWVTTPQRHDALHAALLENAKRWH